MRRLSCFELALALFAMLDVGCGSKSVEPEPVRITLITAPVAASRKYNLVVEVPVPADGLQFRFFADDGECEPEKSREPRSVFTPPPGAQSAKLTVEALRDDQVVARDFKEIAIPLEPSPNVPLQPEVRPPPPVPQLPPALDGASAIQITQIPSYDPTGGPDTRAEIAGVVTGIANVTQYRIVLYARTDLWYVQPLLGSTIAIEPNGRWSSWTHTGTRYAALLVRNGYHPSPQLGSYPSQDGGDVVAVTEVEGKR